MSSRVAARAAAIVLGALAAAALGEGLARNVAAPARINVVAPSPSLEVTLDPQGAVYWQHTDPARRNEACAAEPRVALFGSSITYGSGVDADETFAAGLQRRRDDWCVHNFGEPAFGYEAKRAVSRTALSELTPSLVFWEIWLNDRARYVRVGDLIYDPADLQRDELGYPLWLPLPPGLHRWLFERSRFYAYASIARAPGGYRAGPDVWSELTSGGELEALKAEVAAGGGVLVLGLWPQLDKPFEDSVASPPSVYEGVRRWAAATDTPLIEVASLLEGEDYIALRADPCCHYSPAGHDALAKRLAPELAALLAQGE